MKAREVDKMTGDGWTGVAAFSDPPEPKPGYVLELRRQAFMGIVTHYRYVKE